MGLRAREIREKLRGKVEPVVLHTLEAMAETQHQHEKHLVEMASMLQQCVLACEGFNIIAENMKNRLEQFQRNQQDSAPDLGPVS